MGGFRKYSEPTAFVQPDMFAGSIIIWSGSIVSIPSGYALCDGTNGTPDLRDRFVVGAGSTYAVGASGGSATHAHTASQTLHLHQLDSGADIAAGTDLNDETTEAAPDITVQSSSSLPPYYALCYIMKL